MKRNNQPVEKLVPKAVRVHDDTESQPSQPREQMSRPNGLESLRVPSSRPAMKKASSFVDKRADLTSSMEMAAKAAQFQDFVDKVRGILAEMRVSDELKWHPEIDDDLLQALEFCKNQRQ